MHPDHPPPQRIRGVFVVSCPRSGSTLLQSMLAQHPDVFSFPETHYFQKIHGRLNGRLTRRVVSPRAAARTLQHLHTTVGSGPPAPRVAWPTVRAYARAFSAVVERATADAGRTVWVEKSPVHLRHLSDIQRFVRDARFVHILRDGRDVTASIYALCLTDPARWLPQVLGRQEAGILESPAGRARVLDAVIERWNQDVATSLEHADDPDHILVRYEDLVADPRRCLERVCAGMDVAFDAAMLRHWEAAPRVVGFRSHAPHMQKAFRPIEVDHLRRYRSVFDGDQRTVVRRQLTAGGELPRDVGLDSVTSDLM